MVELRSLVGIQKKKKIMNVVIFKKQTFYFVFKYKVQDFIIDFPFLLYRIYSFDLV